MSDITQLSLIDVTAAIRSGELSSLEVTHACLDRIAAIDSALNAFIAIDAEGALDQARAADKARAEGQATGLLHGVPLAHKDMFYRKGQISGCGSLIRRDWRAAVTADALQRLDSAGALTLGRLGMSEFAIGPIGLNAHNGHVRNPWALDHVSGGSSSGPAAATAAGLTYGALGSDTGASIRVPAAACGVVGLKPTPGLISLAGAMPLSWTLDVAGPLARTVSDVALLTAVLAQPADIDLTAGGHGAFLDLLARDPDAPPDITIGVPDRFFTEKLHPDVANGFSEAVAVLRGLGLRIVEADTSAFADAWELYGVILGYEAAAFHARYLDGRAESYAPQIHARLKLGRTITREAYADAIAKRALLARRAMAQGFAQADVLVAPVLSSPPPTIAAADVGAGPGMAEVVGEFLRFTAPANVLGLPALSVPSGLTPSGLPNAVQFIGPPWSETTLLQLGRAFEHASGWRHSAPTAVRRLSANDRTIAGTQR